MREREGFILLGLGAVLCLVTACHHKSAHKQLSPEAARQLQLAWNTKTLVEAHDTVGTRMPSGMRRQRMR